MEQLSEEIQSLQQQLRACLQERTKLESQKNTLDNLLSSNLLRRKEQLQQELEEISLDDNRQQLEMKTAELEHLLVTMEQSRTRAEGLCVLCSFLGYVFLNFFFIYRHAKHILCRGPHSAGQVEKKDQGDRNSY